MSVNVEALKAAVETARRQNAYAESLNCRGGSFKVYWLQQHFAERLRSVGATCLMGLDPSILALPPLDAVEVQRVEAESPSTITLCGINLPVVYSQYAQPEVVMQEVDAIRTCQEWPSQLLLPSGKNVYLKVVDQRGATILWGVDLAEQRSQLIDTVRDRTINAREEFVYPDDGTSSLCAREIGEHPITKQAIVVGYWWEGEPGWRHRKCLEISAAKAEIAKLEAVALAVEIRKRSEHMSDEIRRFADQITDDALRWETMSTWLASL